jgi:O-antigen/teichoic acid export membrane protein
MSKQNGKSWDFSVTLLGQILIALQGLLVVPIIVKGAGAVSYGTFVLLGNLIFTSFGALTSLQYLYRRRLVSATSVVERRELIGPQLLFHFIGLAVIVGSLTFASKDLERWLLGNPNAVSWWMLSGLLGSYFLASQVRDYYRFTLRFGVFNFTLVSSLYLFLALSAGWALTGHVLSINMLFLLQIVSFLCVSLPFIPIIINEIGWPPLQQPKGGFGKEFLLNLPFLSEMTIDFILAFSDRYLIALFVSISAVAAYQPAYQLASLAMFLPRFAGVLLVPHLSGMVDKGERAEAERILQIFMKVFLMVAIPFTVGIGMLGSSVLALLTTPEIAATARWVGPIVAVASIFYGFILLMDPVALALGRNRALIIAYAAGAIVNIALNLVLLPTLQNVHAAAISTVAGYAITCVWIWGILGNHWRLTLPGWEILRYLVASLVMAAALLMMGHSPAETRMIAILPLMASVVIGVMLYFATLFVIGGLGRTEVAEIVGLFDSTSV